jgi:pilus assembly protein Flp/PilA
MRPETKKFLHRLRRLLTLDHGQDLVEYALVVGLIALGATASLRAFATGISSAFNTISTNLNSEM